MRRRLRNSIERRHWNRVMQAEDSLEFALLDVLPENTAREALSDAIIEMIQATVDEAVRSMEEEIERLRP